MKAVKTWVLIADGARARVLVNTGPGNGLRPAMNHEFAASHAPSRDLGTDKPGRGQGGDAAHGVKTEDLHERQKESFTRDVAEMVSKAAEENDYDRLVIAAPPATLGRLRDALSPKARERVIEEINKDLTHVRDQDVTNHLSANI